MRKIALSVLLGAIAGFAVARLGGFAGGGLGGVGGYDPDATATREAAVAALRLDALESALAAERQARTRLESTVAALVASAPAPIARTGAADTGSAADPPAAGGDTLPGSLPPGAGFRPPPDDAATLGRRLIEAGFTPERSAYLVGRVEALRLDALEARYQAQRDGDRSRLRELADVDTVLRAELGDADYTRYLTAMGRPTDVPVGGVLANSPAAVAGFLPGDRIVGYAGQRVFDMRELTALTFEGQPGESIAVDVVRDGQTIQLYLPRGPLGISGRRGGRGP